MEAEKEDTKYWGIVEDQTSETFCIKKQKITTVANLYKLIGAKGSNIMSFSFMIISIYSHKIYYLTYILPLIE